LELFACHFSRPNENDCSNRTLAPLVVRNSVNGDLADRRMLNDYFLDVLGKNVDAAGNDHVFLSINQMEEAVGISKSHVSRMQPSVDDCLVSEIGPLVIARHQHWSTAGDFSHFAGGKLVPLGGDDTHLAERDWTSHRIDLRGEIATVENGDESFGQPVKLVKGTGKTLQQTLLVFPVP